MELDVEKLKDFINSVESLMQHCKVDIEQDNWKEVSQTRGDVAGHLGYFTMLIKILEAS